VVYPQTIVQTCNLIRHSLKYVPGRSYDQVVTDLRPIYTVLDADAAHAAPEGSTRSGASSTARTSSASLRAFMF
jgi:transposase-like protein